jgi:hypothetical protein
MMAAITLFASVLGRPASALRVLALAVTGLLLVDPMLVRSVGFLLSVGACTGIALLARPIGDRLPGPMGLRTALGVTLAAQIGVAPVLIPVFGPLPLASIPANLLAIPAAGPIMTWGMTAGLVAGASGGVVASAIHLPTRLLIGWVALIARVGADLPLGGLGLVQLALAVGLCVAAARILTRRRVRVVALAVALAITAGPAGVAAARPPPALDGDSPVAGVRIWREGGATVVVLGSAGSGQALSALRAAGVRTIDLLALESPSASAAATATVIGSRVAIRHVVRGGTAELAAGDALTVGPLLVTFPTTKPRLVVQVCAPSRLSNAARMPGLLPKTSRNIASRMSRGAC